MTSGIAGSGTVAQRIDATTAQLTSRWSDLVLGDKTVNTPDNQSRIRGIAQAIVVCEDAEAAMQAKEQRLLGQSRATVVFADGEVSVAPSSCLKKNNWLHFVVTPSEDKFVAVSNHWAICSYGTKQIDFGQGIVKTYRIASQHVMEPTRRGNLWGTEFYAIQGIKYESLGFKKRGDRYLAPHHYDFAPIQETIDRWDHACNPSTSSNGDDWDCCEPNDGPFDSPDVAMDASDYA